LEFKDNLLDLNHPFKISIVMRIFLLRSFILECENKMLVSSALIIGMFPHRLGQMFPVRYWYIY
jgi:hypothetical protein